MGAGLLLSGGEVDFMIKGVFSFEIGGQTLWITTTHICLLIVVLTLCIFALCANRTMKKASDVPSGFQNVVELIVDMLDGIVRSTMGKNATGFLNYIGTIFIFILFCNLWFAGTSSTNSGLWCYIPTGRINIYTYIC